MEKPEGTHMDARPFELLVQRHGQHGMMRGLSLPVYFRLILTGNLFSPLVMADLIAITNCFTLIPFFFIPLKIIFLALRVK